MGQTDCQKKSETRGMKMCPYSNNCFTCPEADCHVNTTAAIMMNKLPYDLERKRAHMNKLRNKER